MRDLTLEREREKIKRYTKRIKMHFRSELNVFSRKKEEESGEGVEIKMIIKMLKKPFAEQKKKNVFYL